MAKRKGPRFTPRSTSNPFLKKIEAEREDILAHNTNKSIQVALDQAIITLSRVFGFGEVRAVRFREAFKKDLLEWAEDVQKDHKWDKETVYSTDKREEELKRILGESYEPIEVRYSGLGHPKSRGW